MKKVVLLITLTLFLTGCVNIQNSSYEQIINYALNNEKIDLKNKSSNGYSYYLPTGLAEVKTNKNNVVFQNEKYRLYMYVDVISYYNNRKETYKTDGSAYFSMPIEKGEKFGYLEINQLSSKKYLVEIMYNYAKIEVIVEECDIKDMVSYALSILTSISYNDTVLENMIGEDILNYNEVEFNIFETAKNESNLIEYDENLDASEEVEENVPDTDLIN